MREYPNLLELFHQLKTPAEEVGRGQCFSVISLPGKPNIKLAKNIDDAPCILIHTNSEYSQEYLAPILLENLMIEFDLECLVYHQDSSVEKNRFSVIICREKTPFIINYFFQVMISVFDTIEENPTNLNIHDALMAVVDLFRCLGQPPKKSTQGLWAELFVIMHSSSPNILIEAWHTTPEDRYDFCAGSFRIEVKSSSQRIRKHHFSLEQLNPPSNTSLLIASVFVERVGGGISINELMEKIKTKINGQPMLIFQLEKIIAQTLGNGLQNGLSERFDYELAENSLRFYDYRVLPSINPNLPSGVSEVKFTSDFNEKQSIDLSYYRSLGGIFEIALFAAKS